MVKNDKNLKNAQAFNLRFMAFMARPKSQQRVEKEASERKFKELRPTLSTSLRDRARTSSFDHVLSLGFACR